MDLTDQQWTIIEPLFEEKRRPDGRGRPWRDAAQRGAVYVSAPRSGSHCWYLRPAFLRKSDSLAYLVK